MKETFRPVLNQEAPEEKEEAVSKQRALLRAYKDGLDSVLENRMAEFVVPGPFILLRGISEHEISASARGIHLASSKNVREDAYFGRSRPPQG